MGSTQSQHASASSAVASATALVHSNSSALSWFDYPVDRQNRGTVVEFIKDLKLEIIAVWLVARPINRQAAGGKFEHWCVKIQAKGALISIDFLEHAGKGAFGLQQHPDIGVQLDDFLVYKIIDPDTNEKKRVKWEIVSSVTPSPLKKRNYFDLMSKQERLMLHEYMKNSKKGPNDPSKFLKSIKCKRNVSDISKFCRMWYADGRGYNAITKNCQQFAAELYRFLIGDYYPEKVKIVFDRYQSPYDKKQWKMEQLSPSTSVSTSSSSSLSPSISTTSPVCTPNTGNGEEFAHFPFPPKQQKKQHNKSIKYSKTKPKINAKIIKKERKLKKRRSHSKSHSKSDSNKSQNRHNRQNSTSNSRKRRSKQTEEFMNDDFNHVLKSHN